MTPERAIQPHNGMPKTVIGILSLIVTVASSVIDWSPANAVASIANVAFMPGITGSGASSGILVLKSAGKLNV